MNGDSGLLNELIGEARLAQKGLEMGSGLPRAARVGVELVVYRAFFKTACKLLSVADGVRRAEAPERFAEENVLT